MFLGTNIYVYICTLVARADDITHVYYCSLCMCIHIGSAAAGPGGTRGSVHVMQEIGTMSTSLPVEWSSSVFLAVDETKSHCMRALITGPRDSPYAVRPHHTDSCVSVSRYHQFATVKTNMLRR